VRYRIGYRRSCLIVTLSNNPKGTLIIGGPLFFIGDYMTTVLTPTSELEAINTILSVIGESPISSLSEISSVADAVTAQSILSEVSRQVQTKGWHFNTEKDFELTPDTFSKEITIPSNTLRVDTSGDSRDTDVVQRGNRLYDRTKHTFQFDKSLKCEIVVLLPFDQLPQAARHYVTIKSARIFQSRTVGSEALYQFTAVDERDALLDLKRAEGITGDYNILTSNPTVFRSLIRE
jgi:hypothetical protein